jgi:hypothetical protein
VSLLLLQWCPGELAVVAVVACSNRCDRSDFETTNKQQLALLLLDVGHCVVTKIVEIRQSGFIGIDDSQGNRRALMWCFFSGQATSGWERGRNHDNFIGCSSG